MKIKKIVVLGSNSFTGSHFVDYVLKNTNIEVIGISRSSEYNPLFLPYLYKKKKHQEKFKFYQLDVNKEVDKIVQILDQEKPDVVVNYAAQGEVRNSWKWPEQWFQTNCLGVVKIANSLVNKKYLKRYIAISTPEVYGSTRKNIKENFKFNPSTPYGASKLAGDLFLFTLFKKYNFPVIFTRSANVYGIHQQLYRIIPRTIIYLKMGKKISLHGGGTAVRSFVNVKDIAETTWKAITDGKNGEVYHLAPEKEEITIKELVQLICKMMGYDFEKSIEITTEDFGQDAIYSLNCTKSKKELKWNQKISLKKGIEEMINWIEENWEEIQQQSLDYIHKI